VSVWVGGAPPRYYAGAITSVNPPYVIVRVADDPDTDDEPASIIATGTGTIGDKVTVLVQSTGRAILIRS
jgi:hypothetical protein